MEDVKTPVKNITKMLRNQFKPNTAHEIETFIEEYEDLQSRLTALQAENKKLRKLLARCANAVHEVVFRYGDNWPEKLGYSKQDFEKLDEESLEVLKEKG